MGTVKFAGGALQRITQIGGDSRVGVIRNHTAHPLTAAECDQLINHIAALEAENARLRGAAQAFIDKSYVVSAADGLPEPWQWEQWRKAMTDLLAALHPPTVADAGSEADHA